MAKGTIAYILAIIILNWILLDFSPKYELLTSHIIRRLTLASVNLQSSRFSSMLINLKCHINTTTPAASEAVCSVYL